MFFVFLMSAMDSSSLSPKKNKFTKILLPSWIVNERKI